MSRVYRIEQEQFSHLPVQELKSLIRLLRLNLMTSNIIM